MVENYPTALRSLVLAENSISPELQQQICDLLSEGEEEEEVAGGPGDTQERERAREPAAHQRGSSSWMGPSGKNPQGLIGSLSRAFPETPAGSTHSSTRGLRPPEHLERHPSPTCPVNLLPQGALRMGP